MPVKATTPETEKIEQLLRTEFPTAEVCRYNSVSIRVRIIDDRFSRTSLVEREEMVLPLIRQLPDETQIDISILLLLAPGEVETSMMNIGFEHPTPTSF